MINYVACEDGHQTCDCSTYLRIELDLANTLGIVSYYECNFIFCSVLKEDLGKSALEQIIPNIPASLKYVDRIPCK